MYKKFLQSCIYFILCMLVFICMFPILLLFSGSVMGADELEAYINPLIVSLNNDYAEWSLIPKQLSFWSYFELLLGTPDFFVAFWHSVKISLFSVIGQVMISAMAAWGLTIYSFGGKKCLFCIYTILMMFPFQVFVLPEYYVLQELKLYDTHWAIILVFILSPFAVILLVQSFKSISVQMIEAARLDGASEGQIFLKIGIPHAKAAMITVMILAFIESWSSIEHPQAFLETKQWIPLALYLPKIDLSDVGTALVASVMAIIPVILLVLLGEEYFEEGIIIKEQDE